MKRTPTQAFGTVADAAGGAAGASTAAPSRIVLNIGGVHYTTTRSTLGLLPETMLGRMFSDANGHDRFQTDDDGSVFIDRNGRLFEWVLDAHRNGGKCSYPAEAIESDRVHAEYVYFGLADPCSPSPTTLARIMAQPLAEKAQEPRTVPDCAILRCVFAADVVSALVHFFRDNRSEVQIGAGVDAISFRRRVNDVARGEQQLYNHYTIEATSCLTWDFRDDVISVSEAESLEFHNVDIYDEDVAAAFEKFDSLQSKDDARSLVRLDVFTTRDDNNSLGIQLRFYPTGDANLSFFCAYSWSDA